MLAVQKHRSAVDGGEQAGAGRYGLGPHPALTMIEPDQAAGSGVEDPESVLVVESGGLGGDLGCQRIREAAALQGARIDDGQHSTLGIERVNGVGAGKGDEAGGANARGGVWQGGGRRGCLKGGAVDSPD